MTVSLLLYALFLSLLGYVSAVKLAALQGMDHTHSLIHTDLL